MSICLDSSEMSIELVTKQNYKEVARFMMKHLAKSDAISPCEYIFAAHTVLKIKKKKRNLSIKK